MATFRTDLSRGDLYWLDWSPGRSSEQAGRRPALVVGTDSANHNPNYPLTIVAAVSRTQRGILTHVVIDATESSGLREQSSAKCEQLMTVQKDRLTDRIGHISDSEAEKVDTALKRALMLS